MNFNTIKKNYDKNLWSLNMVKTALKKGVITKEEYQTITNEEAPNLTLTLDQLKEKKLVEVDKWTESKIVSGFESTASGESVFYDSDKDTQLTMQGIALNVKSDLFSEKYPTGCPVRGYDKAEGDWSKTKTIHMLTSEQVLLWCADLSIHIGTCKQLGWTKQEEVLACSSKEELDNISLD